jgi:g-D-glutamyl-meso-diaminopimelate peptidase
MIVTVRQGDTLWYYSRLFNVPIRLVIDSNPNTNPERLRIGEEIAVPGYLVNDYQINADDTLWTLASERRVPLDALYLLNPGIDPQNLAIGQQIQLPVRVTSPVVVGKKEYDYEALVTDIRQLLTIYPFLRQEKIGDSVMGKALPELRIGRGSKRVHLNGSFHANEWITTPVIMTFLNDYLLALTNGETIRGLTMAPFYESVSLSIVPMVDPDGVNLVINGLPEEEPYRSTVLEINNGSTDFSDWKANIRGVDLNNQFPARWEIEAERKPQQPAPRDYPGEAPLTEPEAVAIAELTGRRDFNRVLAFHTQGEVIYWGFLGLEPPESQVLVEEFARVSGYTPIRYVDSYAGYKDWFIQEWRRPGFTVELGEGVNPLPLSQFDEIYQESLGIFLASLYM